MQNQFCSEICHLSRADQSSASALRCCPALVLLVKFAGGRKQSVGVQRGDSAWLVCFEFALLQPLEAIVSADKFRQTALEGKGVDWLSVALVKGRTLHIEQISLDIAC